MYKYWEISKVHMKEQLTWRADVVFNMLFTIVKILFAYLLWGIIFQGKSMIGQFTFHGTMEEMIEICVPNMVAANPRMSEEEARKSMLEWFPTLKRWKN